MTNAPKIGAEHIEYVGSRPKDDQSNAIRERLCNFVKGSGCFYELVPERFYLVHLAKNTTLKSFNKTLPAKSPFIWWSPFLRGERHRLFYEAFNRDFGPFNLAVTHQFCSKIKVWVDTYEHRDPDKCIVVVLGDECPKKKLNTTLLAGIATLVLFHKNDEEVVTRLNCSMKYKAKPGEQIEELTFNEKRKFFDVSGCQFMNISLTDCLLAFHAAIQFDWYDYYKFDHAEYLFYETVTAGDLNWIVPGKILAFAGPSSCEAGSRKINHRFPPQFYYHYFKDHNVTSIVRLNDPEYGSSEFTDIGFEHHDLIFPDGFPPTSTIAEKFIKIVDEAKGAVAVHCYAGIGRTGTLIAAYLVARFGCTPQMAIAWTRICRPGSVIGQQQLWLTNKFKVTRTSKTRRVKTKDYGLISLPAPETVSNIGTAYSVAEKTYGQAKALVMSKKHRLTNDRPNTRSTTLNQSTENGDVRLTPSVACPKPDLILDLGKTVPTHLQYSDVKHLEGKRNPEYYILNDDKYQWKVKFPQNSYVTLKHDYDKDMHFIDGTNVELCSRAFSISLEFRYEDGEVSGTLKGEGVNGSEQFPRKTPMVYYNLSLSSFGSTLPSIANLTET